MQKNLLPNTQDKKVFITGASSGIGYALCEEYLKQGWSVIGLARDSSKIPDKTKKNNNFEFVKVDLSDGFDNFSFENAKKTFNTNVLSIYLTLELINKNFKLSSKHTLAIMSSTAGYKGLPKSLLYGPSKAALINLAESIKSENSNDLNIKLICPGFVETPATKVNTFKMPFLMLPSKAAGIIFDKIYKKGFEITFPFPFNSIMKFGKILPYKLYFKFTEKKFSKK